METPDNLPDAMRLAINSVLSSKWTATPAVVKSYNSSTKRASALPLPMFVDDGDLRHHPIINDIPVMWLGGGGFVATAPLAAGDTVLLVFCRRGINSFKEGYAEDSYPTSGVMEIDSAVAIPCFGSLSVEPSYGLSLQKEDGSVKVEVLDDEVVLTNNGFEMTLGGDGIVTALDFKTTTGVSLLTHTHPTAPVGPISPPTPTA